MNDRVNFESGCHAPSLVLSLSVARNHWKSCSESECRAQSLVLIRCVTRKVLFWFDVSRAKSCSESMCHACKVLFWVDVSRAKSCSSSAAILMIQMDETIGCTDYSYSCSCSLMIRHHLTYHSGTALPVTHDSSSEHLQIFSDCSTNVTLFFSGHFVNGPRCGRTEIWRVIWN